MGQYYKPYLRFEDGTEETYSSQSAIFLTKHHLADETELEGVVKMWNADPDSWGYNFSGLKLLEHSWMKNDFVNGVLERIWDNPANVAWVGDYSDEEANNSEIGGFDMDVYGKVWSDKALPKLAFPELPKVHRKGYLINHDLGVYVSLSAFEKTNGKKDGEYYWCLHPLPMLTAIGNGKGCGDYPYNAIGAKHVGEWALDLLSFSETKPDGMSEIWYKFDSAV